MLQVHSKHGFVGNRPHTCSHCLSDSVPSGNTKISRLHLLPYITLPKLWNLVAPSPYSLAISSVDLGYQFRAALGLGKFWSKLSEKMSAEQLHETSSRVTAKWLKEKKSLASNCLLYTFCFLSKTHQKCLWTNLSSRSLTRLMRKPKRFPPKSKLTLVSS